MKSEITRIHDEVSWTHQDGDHYLIIGTLPSGKKFRQEYSNPHYALGINLYRGRLYLVREGKRHLLREVFN